jgi:hypothetical protein
VQRVSRFLVRLGAARGMLGGVRPSSCTPGFTGTSTTQDDAMRHQTRHSNDFTRRDQDRERTAVVPTRPDRTPVEVPTVPATHPALDPARFEDAIRTRAYYLWEEAGRPAGDGVPFWLAAEHELRGQ